MSSIDNFLASAVGPTKFYGSHSQQATLLRVGILVLIGVLALLVRLFSVLRYESVIHEFDPYFNFRSTKYLVNEGFYNFHNWFDEFSWYPLGRITGGTVYPGLMVTAAFFYHLLNFFNITVAIRNVCVLLAPVFAAKTAFALYLFTREMKDASAGLFAAAFISIVPGYISRSVAGSFDNEGIAIFALVFTFFLWVKAVNTGSLFWGSMCAIGYFYMVSAWGGYVFIINLIPIHVLALLVTGRFSSRIYIAYNSMYVIGTLLSMQVTFVGFQPVQSSEHMGALGVFGLVQIYCAINWVKSLLPSDYFQAFFRLAVIFGSTTLGLAAVVGILTGYISPWTGRFYALLDPTYAKEHIPIIASVSEHQPTTWSSFLFDLHCLVFLIPVGFYFSFKHLNDANIFGIIYGILSVYFAGVMVRLMLVLAPVACALAAIGISSSLRTYMAFLRPTKKTSKSEVSFPVQKEVALVIVAGIAIMLIFYTHHCVWVTSEAYSSPSIVLAAKQPDGSRIIFDDFREAYYWLRYNSAPDAKIMSWWDYGYQISAMANRTILVDNNTWNNSHIAQVGKAFASTEEKAYDIMRKLDVDYVLIIFGGLTGYSSDDINKFLWMVRIAGSTDPNIKEMDYYSPSGEYRIDAQGSPLMLNTLMYKLCYYGFGTMYTEQSKPPGYDRVRNAEIGNKNFDLTYLEESFTSEHWLVRVYKVKPPVNRGVEA